MPVAFAPYKLASATKKLLQLPECYCFRKSMHLKSHMCDNDFEKAAITATKAFASVKSTACSFTCVKAVGTEFKALDWQLYQEASAA